ncbi:FixJ family two-component response regulator [Bradyrhizobium sp. USDA 4011]
MDIFVLGAGVNLRKSLKISAEDKNLELVCFGTTPALLSLAKQRVPACILLIFSASPLGMSALKSLRSQNFPSPIIVIVDKPDLAVAVEAMRNGAYDVIERTRCVDLLGEAEAAIAQAALIRTASPKSNTLQPYLPGRELLTPREQEILARVVLGETSKETARFLKVSARTVECHRAKIMRKLDARNVLELYRRVLREAVLSADRGG